MNLISSILIFYSSSTAFACEPAKNALHVSFPASAASDASPAQVSFILDHGILRAHFEVKSPKIFGKPKFGPKEFPFMFDVAEVFVSVEGGLPYYEFELTPNGQTFQVKILSPKKPFQEGLNLGLEKNAVITTQGWTTDLGIPLERLGWKGDTAKIVGNAYVILGQKPSRKFYSLSLPVQEKPNFHLPEFFKPLLDCPK